MTRRCTDLGGSCLELDDAEVEWGVLDDPAYDLANLGALACGAPQQTPQVRRRTTTWPPRTI